MLQVRIQATKTENFFGLPIIPALLQPSLETPRSEIIDYSSP